MTQHFSIGRVLAEAGGLIARRWPVLPPTVLLYGLALAGLHLATERLPAEMLGLIDSSAVDLRSLGGQAAQTVIDSLALALILSALLSPAAGLRGAEGRLAALRSAAVHFPAILLAQGLIVLPMLIATLLRSLAVSLAIGLDLSLASVAWRIALLVYLGGIGSLMALAVLGMAPPAAVAENRPARDALRRSLELTRKRGPLLFGLYLAAFLVLAVAGYAPVFLILQQGAAIPIWVSWITAPLAMTVKALAFAALFLELRRLSAPTETAATAAAP